MPLQRKLLALIAAAACIPVLAACTDVSTPEATATVSSSESAEPSSTPTPDPVFVPSGSAEENRAFFDWTASAVITSDPDAKGRDFIDALVAAGFSKSDMQVTPDETSIGLAADSVQFSVKIGDLCLVGQYGPKSDGYHGDLVAPIATGACLVGRTRTIDW
jgi:hypothetical protein